MSDFYSELRRYAGVCGEWCFECKEVQAGQCRGCAYQLGEADQRECDIFICAIVQRGIEHCGLCAAFPCQTFLNAADSVKISKRIANLRLRLALGTDHWLKVIVSDVPAGPPSGSQP